MSVEYKKVICVRITDVTYDKLIKLQDKFDDMTISKLARECLIRGIARMETEKNDKSK